MSSQPASAPIGGLSPDAFSSLFQAVNGLRNRRALFAMLGCMVVGVLVFGLFSFLAVRLGFFMAFLGGLALFVAGATGVNAAGILLMDQARGLPPRALGEAISAGLLCIPKFILLGLALFAVSLVVFVAIALAYVVCKIPLLGPLLFVVVFPLSVVISGLTLCGLFLCLFLALPAIWEGATITRAIAQALAIARSRLVESILLMAVLWLLSLVIGIIVFGVLVTGLMPTIGLSASILGGDGLGGMLGMMRRRGEFGAEMGGFGSDGSVGMGSAAYALAAGVGGGLLWALAGSLLSMVSLLGLNLVYLRVTEGLDSGAAEAALKARTDEARRQAADLGQKARDKAQDVAERAREQARSATPSGGAAAAGTANASPAAPTSSPHAPPAFSPAPTPAAPTPREPPSDSTMPAMSRARACPQCLSAVGRDDAFCGACGHKLK